MFFGALAGGAGAKLGGGNFWQGAVTGAVVAVFNHYVHSGLNHLAHEISKPKFVVAGIYGFGGEGVGDNDRLSEIVTSEGGTMFSSNFGEGDGEIIDFLREGYEQGKGIKIFGYSRGGNAAIRITNKLGAMGINVFQLTTFDPHSMIGGFQLLYNNVANLYNFYQQNPSDFWTKGILKADNPFLGSPIKTNFSPAGYQVNYTGEYYKPGVLVNHLNIIRHAW